MIGCLPRSQLISQMVTAPGGGKLGMVESLSGFKLGLGFTAEKGAAEAVSQSPVGESGDSLLKPFASRSPEGRSQ